jgi:hypothetical protein
MARFVLVAIATFIAATPCQAEIPKLFREKEFTCVTLAEAVNQYIGLGEEAAAKEFDSIVPDQKSEFKLSGESGFTLKTRVAWVCRIVFQPKENEPLRPPLYGALRLPWNSMPLKSWPLYPISASGSTYFVLSEGYTLAGKAENPKEYLKYCRAEGRFRKQPVPIPSRAQAMKDLERLRKSEAWKAIKWKDKGQGFEYTISEDWVWDFIKKQAESIPEK